MEAIVPFCVPWSVLLIADFNIFKWKRCRVSVCSSHSAIPGVGRANRILDCIQHIIHDILQRIIRNKLATPVFAANAGDGGLYAEMVRNRGFEDNRLPAGTTLVNGHLVPRRTPHYNMNGKVSDWTMPWDDQGQWPGWKLEQLSGSDISLSLSTEKPLNPATPQSLEIRINRLIGENNQLLNTGYWGMGIKKSQAYDLCFYVSNTSYKGPLVVSLQSKNGNTLAMQRFQPEQTGKWTKYSAKLTAQASDDSARLAITFLSTGTLKLDFVSLFPEETFLNRRNGLRKDLAQFIAGLKPAFVRFALPRSNSQFSASFQNK